MAKPKQISRRSSNTSKWKAVNRRENETMLVAVRFTINNKQYNGYIDNEALFDRKPLLERVEAFSLMEDINTTFVDEAEMVYDEVNDNFYDDGCSCDDHSGKDYVTEDGIKHLYDFADDYFDDWIAEKRKVTLYKDVDGNLLHYNGKGDRYHEMVVVDYEDGHYIYTHNAWYFTDSEFNNCTKIEVEVE
jgi:hypothetical protein